MSGLTPQRRVRGAATVFSDYSSVLLARLGSALLSVISVLITTRILDPSGYGTVAYAVVIALLIFTVTSAWTSTAVSRYGREELEERGSMAAVTWSRIWLTAPLLSIAALIVVLIKLAGGFPAELTWGLTGLAIAYGIVLVASEHVVYSLEASGRMKASAAQLIGQQFLSIVALAVILATGIGKSAIVLVAIYTVSLAIFTVAYGTLIYRTALWPPRVDPALRRRIFRFSAPLVAFTLSQYVIRSVDLFVVSAFASATAVGIYAVAYQAYSVLQQLTTASGHVLTPLFVSLRRAGKDGVVDRYVERAVPQLTLIGSTIAGVAVPFVAIAVPIVFGRNFSGAADPLAILLFAIVLGLLTNLLAPILVVHERTKPIGVINVVAALVNVVADIVLVGYAKLPLIGPAIATVVAMAIVCVGYAVIVRGCTSVRSPLPFAALLPFVAGFVPAVTLSNNVALPVSVAGTALCAGATMLWTRPFRREDLELIARLDMPGPLKRLTVRTLGLTAR
jgi:O-antigen/teichoic acid export membrane protein